MNVAIIIIEAARHPANHIELDLGAQHVLIKYVCVRKDNVDSIDHDQAQGRQYTIEEPAIDIQSLLSWQFRVAA